MDRGIAHEEDAGEMGLCDSKHQLADAAGRKRIRSDASGRRVNRPAGPGRFSERWPTFRFDSENARRAFVPTCHATNQSASPNRHENAVELRRLSMKLQPQRALPEQRLDLVESVHAQRTGSCRPLVTGGKGIRVSLARD